MVVWFVYVTHHRTSNIWFLACTWSSLFFIHSLLQEGKREIYFAHDTFNVCWWGCWNHLETIWIFWKYLVIFGKMSKFYKKNARNLSLSLTYSRSRAAATVLQRYFQVWTSSCIGTAFWGFFCSCKSQSNRMECSTQSSSSTNDAAATDGSSSTSCTTKWVSTHYQGWFICFKTSNWIFVL